jgi:hypothetical protein
VLRVLKIDLSLALVMRLIARAPQLSSLGLLDVIDIPSTEMLAVLRPLLVAAALRVDKPFPPRDFLVLLDSFPRLHQVAILGRAETVALPHHVTSLNIAFDSLVNLADRIQWLRELKLTVRHSPLLLKDTALSFPNLRVLKEQAGKLTAKELLQHLWMMLRAAPRLEALAIHYSSFELTTREAVDVRVVLRVLSSDQVHSLAALCSSWRGGR